MKIKDVLYQLSISEEYKQFSRLFHSLTEKSGKITEEEAKAVSDAAGKVTKKFIETMNPTISSIISCCRVYGNEGLTQLRYSRRIKELKKAITLRCVATMPDYYLFLQRRLPELWKLKKKKSR